MHSFDISLLAEARMRNKAMKQEALQAAREAKKERGEKPWMVEFIFSNKEYFSFMWKNNLVHVWAFIFIYSSDACWTEATC